MSQRGLPKRTLPKQEKFFWRKMQTLVLSELADRVWFPSWWLSSEVPNEFKEFMFYRFSSVMRSDEESLHAWSLAVRAVIRYLVNRPEVEMVVLYDYPTCDGFPYLLLRREGKVLGLVSLHPVDYDFDDFGDWKELRDFLLKVADTVRAVLGNQSGKFTKEKSVGAQ
jgi:hypothetical protein